jgi:hypothetical protein
VKGIFSLADEICIFLHVHLSKEEKHVKSQPAYAARTGDVRPLGKVSRQQPFAKSLLQLIHAPTV